MNAKTNPNPRRWEPHPISLCWPEPGPARYQEMLDDIAAQGQKVPIQLFEDKVLDGKTRMQICEQLGIEPIAEVANVKTYEEAVALAVSLNDKRRDLTLEERSFVAARLANLEASHNKSRALSPDNARTLEEAAQIMKVSKPSVARAKLVIKEDEQRGEGPKLEKAIVSNRGKRGKGKPTLSGVAADIAKERQKRKKAAPPKRVGKSSVIDVSKTIPAEEIDPELYEQSPGLFVEKYGQGPYYKTRAQYEAQWDEDARRAWVTALREAAKCADAVKVLPSEMARRRWIGSSPTAAANLKAWAAALCRLCESVEELQL